MACSYLAGSAHVQHMYGAFLSQPANSYMRGEEGGLNIVPGRRGGV